MCMVARGVEKHASSTVTCAARGACEADGELRTELLQILNSAFFGGTHQGMKCGDML